MINFEDLELISILPPSINDYEDIKALANAIGNQLKITNQAIKKLVIIPNIDEQPEEILDLLAWQYRIDFYEQSLSLDLKRTLIKCAIKWHRQKGTPAIVEEAVKTLFQDARVYEWWEYNGRPYSFRVELKNPIDDPIKLKKLKFLVNAVKNARSWMMISTLHEFKIQFFVGIGTHKGIYRTIRIELPKNKGVG